MSSKVLMVDGWSGNDYSAFLCTALKNNSTDVGLVVLEDRKIEKSHPYYVYNILPSKKSSVKGFKKLLRYFGYLVKLPSIIYRDKYDIIHFQSFRKMRVESMYFPLLRLLGKKLYYTVHDVEPLTFKKADDLFSKLIYHTASRLIVHSETNKKTLISKYKIDESRISVVPHGNFTDYSNNTTIEQQISRKKFGITEKENVILFFGFIKEYKGLDILIKALAIASRHVPDLVLLAAGEVEPEELKKKIEMELSNLPSSVRSIVKFGFVGEDEMADYFRSSDVVALPYRRISHSGILHLTYSFAKPIVATKVGDFEEFIFEDKTGFLVDKPEPELFAEAIVKAFSDKIKLKQMGDYAYNFNKENFSWENVSRLLQQVYEKQ